MEGEIYKMRAQTIQIFLPDGSPRSIRLAEFTSGITQIIVIPRNKLEEAKSREELQNVGIYFLFGSSDDKAKDQVYIGESENCFERLKQHNAKKDFWNTALVVISKTNSLTKSYIKYLEHFTYKKAKEVGRYEVENSMIPKESHISEWMQADLMHVFEEIKTLIGTLGYPLFEKLHEASTKQEEVLTCKGKEAYATGEYTDDGFVVFKGSKANVEEARTAGASVINMRKKLLNSDIVVQKENVYLFKEDYIFNSPSAAAAAVLGRRANGWTEWKDNDGHTLDKLKRQN